VTSPIDAYPLAWPVGWPRVTSYARKPGRYSVLFTKARDEAVRSVELLGGRGIVLSTNIPLRRDGLPYAGMAEPADPGVAIYWEDRKRQPRVIACDAWSKVRDNVRAVGLTLEGLRAIDRAGASAILDRAFTGFAALPASTSPPWQATLGVVGRPTREEINEAYKALARIHHPDAPTGDVERMLELNAARAAAFAELGYT